jgi:hypothetical protein
MRRSIIAIIAVACLQVSYIAYTHIEILRDQVKAAIGSVTEPVVVRPKVADLRAADEPTYFGVFGDPDEAVNDDLVAHRTQNYVERTYPTVVPAVAGPVKKRARRGTKGGFQTNPVRFNDTIITIARSDPYRFASYSEPARGEAKAYTQTRATEADDAKKNPLRKAVPVVKKPYVWIKALGSSLK